MLYNASSMTRLMRDRLLTRPRRHLHFTPTSALWLNLVECSFSILIRRCLQCGTFIGADRLKATIQDYIEQTNRSPKPFVWTRS
jgi:hypothetical protein